MVLINIFNVVGFNGLSSGAELSHFVYVNFSLVLRLGVHASQAEKQICMVAFMSIIINSAAYNL
jgi:hypothetical protein